MALAALGVVFGDIGTSPLYALQTVFSADHGAVKPTEGDVFGVISLVFWSITLIVSIEFVLFIMRADNDGEGGILALIAKVESTKLDSRKVKFGLIAIGMFGVALFYGDGMITPAISVLSAIEGLKVAAPALAHVVVPITIAVIIGLFAIQSAFKLGAHRHLAEVMDAPANKDLRFASNVNTNVHPLSLAAVNAGDGFAEGFFTSGGVF